MDFKRLFAKDEVYGFSNRFYCFAVLLLCLSYFALETYYSNYAAFSVDDFWLAFHNYEYKNGLPYRDFLPYKTVLGYYIFLLPFVLVHGFFSPLLFAKLWVALLNTAFLVGISFWMQKIFSSRAVFLALLFIVPTQAFLCYSCEIRVDILAYWFCLISVICIFEERYILSGLALGIGFFICQKVLCYFFASNCALLGCLFWEERNRSSMKSLLFFNASFLLNVALYLAFWGYFSNLQTVFSSVFYEAYLILSVTWYENLKAVYWSFIINNNPGMILLWPFFYFALFILPIKKPVFTIIYATVISFFMISSRQPFLYFLLGALPVFFLVYASFFSVCFRGLVLSNNKKILITFFSGCYLLFLMFLFYRFHLAAVYCIVALIPLLIQASFFSTVDPKTKSYFKNIIMVVVVLIGIIFPMLRFVEILAQVDGHYQKKTLMVLNGLLQDGDSYIAGIPFLHHIKQPVPGLVHLVGPSVDYLKHPTASLEKIMHLQSLYFNPANTDEIIQSIKKSSIKLYVDNGRFHYLPEKIHRYLATEFKHFWGSIFLYAPQVKEGDQEVWLKFSGNYVVEAKNGAKVFINKKKVAPNSVLYLAKQILHSEADTPYRLTLMPTGINHLLDAKYQKNDWQQMSE